MGKRLKHRIQLFELAQERLTVKQISRDQQQINLLLLTSCKKPPQTSQISSGRPFVYALPASGFTPKCRSAVCINLILKFPLLFLWQAYDKPGLMVITLSLDLTPVKLYDLPCNSESKSGSPRLAGTGIVRPEKLLKNML